jgi:hypothetical protein
MARLGEVRTRHGGFGGGRGFGALTVSESRLARITFNRCIGKSILVNDALQQIEPAISFAGLSGKVGHATALSIHYMSSRSILPIPIARKVSTKNIAENWPRLSLLATEAFVRGSRTPV